MTPNDYCKAYKAPNSCYNNTPEVNGDISMKQGVKAYKSKYPYYTINYEYKYLFYKVKH